VIFEFNEIDNVFVVVHFACNTLRLLCNCCHDGDNQTAAHLSIS
jgi:hypothetical protein